MKKILIAFIVLAVLAAASVSAFVIAKKKSDTRTQEQNNILADNILFQLESDKTSKIEISCADDNYTFEYQNFIWNLTHSDKGDSFSVNQSVLTGIATTFGSLTADTNYGAATTDTLKRYGLDKPYTVTVYNDGNAYTLNIGNISPTGDYYYVTAEGKENVYAVASSDITSLMFDRLGLMSNELIPYTDNELSEIILKRDGKVVYDLTFDNTTGIWSLPEEYSLIEVDQSVTSRIETNMTRLTAEVMLGELDDLAAYGFDKPYAEMTIKGSDGTEQKLLFSYYGNDSDTYTYVYLENAGIAEVYYTYDVRFIEYDIFDLVLQKVENASMYNVSEFSFKCAEAEDSFQVNTTDETAQCRGTEIKLGNAEIFGFFRNFYNSFSYLNITGIDIDAKPELKDPVLSASYTLNDGSTVSVDLVSTGNGSDCYLFKNGKYTGNLVSSDFISSGNSSMINLYNTLCSHAGIEPNS